MYEKNIRSNFKDFNIPRQERIPGREKLSYEDKLRSAAEHLSQFADFHGIIDRLEKIKEEEKRKADPVLNFIYHLQKVKVEKS
ncbi:hypothetical protein [Clostridium thermarum]|uniref:hypothetical protein n=1 Tax=Clostridium thermarum TaxID=1716543 RepID=UPI001FAAB3F0|nr:hypothetical protein [Clostridium thermarum]